jgi:transcription initiation factor TFIID TATA-box-binding protein
MTHTDKDKQANEPKPKIENIIASTHLEGELDIEAAAKVLDVKYSEEFPGIIAEDKEAGIAVLMFANGGIVQTGAKNLSDVGSHFRDVAQKLKHAKLIEHVTLQAKVKNIMASHDIGKKLNLDLALQRLKSGKTKYVPEEFPGIIYELESPSVTVLIFKSGKIALTGARKMSDIDEAAEMVAKELVPGE